MSEEKQEQWITITPNGPYVVTGGVPLTTRYPAMSTYGEPLAWDPVGAEETTSQVQAKYALCRCGQSGNKPYCDGTHARVGFDGTVTAGRQPSATRRERYEADGLVMTDEPGLCVHAGFCGTRFTNVWEMIKRNKDPEVRARLLEMVKNCPSGRLEVTLAEASAPVEPAFTPSIATMPDGPLWVRGGITVQTIDGVAYEIRNRVTLCRCGQSHNKPFCDGTHVEAGFKTAEL
ncbi:MAG: CDGSH iron-sulfur domain-containing protein [Chloroflexi bacterium]|nr:CDGSH iron-sulfur domain-containing protein [Chloroflexota bacterium]